MFRVLCSILVLLCSTTLVTASERLIVFVPASLGDVVKSLANSYRNQHGQEAVLSIAGTAQLARQLDAGAPADIFISADRRWMDWAQKRDLIDTPSKTAFAGNRLVLAIARQGAVPAEPKTLVTQNPFAMGEPDSVPVGHYARQALEKLGWWKEARENAVYSENARLTLRRLARGEVGSAIVYITDFAFEPKVKTAMTFEQNTHTPIVYWAAKTSGTSKDADGFLNFLSSSAAQTILSVAGFSAAPEVN